MRITVVDYSAEQAKLYTPMGNEALPLFLSLPRPEWSKVRWINLQGMSWDCILVSHELELYPGESKADICLLFPHTYLSCWVQDFP